MTIQTSWWVSDGGYDCGHRGNLGSKTQWDHHQEDQNWPVWISWVKVHEKGKVSRLWQYPWKVYNDGFIISVFFVYFKFLPMYKNSIPFIKWRLPEWWNWHYGHCFWKDNESQSCSMRGHIINIHFHCFCHHARLYTIRNQNPCMSWLVSSM